SSPMGTGDGVETPPRPSPHGEMLTFPSGLTRNAGPIPQLAPSFATQTFTVTLGVTCRVNHMTTLNAPFMLLSRCPAFRIRKRLSCRVLVLACAVPLQEYPGSRSPLLLMNGHGLVAYAFCSAPA